jgi:mono/diheme cytochrome c family protein
MDGANFPRKLNQPRSKRQMKPLALVTSRYRVRPGTSGAWMVFLVGVLCVGCQQEMAKQPKYLPLEGSRFFADGRSARPPVAGTVARGQFQDDPQFFQGLVTADPDSPSAVAAATEAKPNYADTFPFPVNRDVLERGKERFTIYCAVCHGALGYGNGIVVQRGFTPPPSYHIDRLRAAPVGYLFRVVSQGLGSMPDYAEQIPPPDRWAIIAYVRALQLSQHAPLKELPQSEQTAALTALEQSP